MEFTKKELLLIWLSLSIQAERYTEKGIQTSDELNNLANNITKELSK